MAKAISKTILSATDNLLEVRQFVSQAARQFGFSEEETSNIALAVDEACTNIIRHAYQNDPNQSIEISIRHQKDKFEVSIVDEGKQFDPQTLRPLDLKEHLSHYRRGGLGVYLMKKLMDRVEYDTLAGKKNQVRLVKFLHSVRSDAGS
ncbi:MAG: ATP-binding protein [Ignavibacteriales bacterium]|nr:ATP-binding protein [Ignavibacteriales bacterium]